MSVPNDGFQPGSESYEGPSGTDTQQNDYTSRTGQKQAPVPVQNDQDIVEDPIDAKTADSDQQLERDDADAINKENIIDERTRGAAKGSYTEPGDEEGLGGSDGRSRVTGGPS